VEVLFWVGEVPSVLGVFEVPVLLGLQIEQGPNPSLSASDNAIPVLEL
jgi:hypothetical protein